MRLIVLKQATDIQALSSKLFQKSGKGKSIGDAAAANATLGRIKALNPHIDFQRLEAGTVLLLPEAPGLKGSDSQSISGDGFAEFAAHTLEGFKTVAERVSAGGERLAEDRHAVNDVLKAGAVKRQLETDPRLKQQLEEAVEEFTAQQKQAQDATKTVDAMQKLLTKELEVIGKLLS